MELLIVRHAIACERDAKRWPDDVERPLSPRGLMRARQAAAGVKRLVPRPQRVLSSPLLRARQTASILTQSAGWPRAAACPQLLPDAPAETLLSVLAQTHEARIALVGHEPELGRLLARCLPGETESAAFELRKMGIALISFPGRARPRRGELRWLLPPKVLRAAR
jgi:phosphohistidine phosphatase